MANCKFCGKSIVWMKDGQKNIPLEDDGGLHECEEFKKTHTSLKKFDRTTLSPSEIARYEQGINSPKK